MELLIVLAIILILLWVFSKTVKQFASLTEHRAETIVVEATQDDMKRRAKSKFDIDTLLQAAENTELARMALDSNPELLEKLKERKAGE